MTDPSRSDSRERTDRPNDADGGELSLDALYALLADRRRRAVLSILSARDGSVTVRDLASAVLEREGVADEGSYEDELTRVRVTLVHMHLPRLADAGVVEYEEERGVAEPTAMLDRFEPHLSSTVRDSVRPE